MGDKPAHESLKQKITVLEQEISRLRDREEKARTMVNAITGMALLIDLKGTVLASNENAPMQFGLTMDEFVGRNIFDFFTPEQAKPRRAAIEQVIQTGKPIRTEREHEGKFYESHLYPILDDQGKVMEISIFLTDTSEYKQVEIALKESEEKFRNIAEQSPNMIFINIAGRVVYVNKLAEEVMGYTREEFFSPAFDFFSIIAPESRKIAGQSMKAHLSGKDVGPREYVLVTKEGKRLDSLITTKLIHYEGHQSILGIVTDITERKLAEKALRESEIKHKTLIHNIPGIVYRADPEWSAEIISDSKRICGYTVEELKKKKKNWLSIIHPDDKDRVFREGSELAKKQKHLVQTYRIVTKEGEVRWVEDRKTSLFSEEGELIGIEGILLDITDRKELEVQLRQAHKMEAIGTLAGGIAHDFNNILAAITGYSELALLHVPEKSRTKVNLDKALKCCDRAKKLIRQILAFSQQSEPGRKPLEIAPLVKESLNLMRSSLPATIRIRRQISKDIGSIEADPTQFQQVLMNLCTNAAQAMQERSGVLDVCLEEVFIDEAASAEHVDLHDGPYLLLRISDTGHGISPDIKERIFDPYFTTRAKDGGTGMGLAMVHGIVKNHNGAIRVTSEPGRGATFSIYFPITRKNAVEQTESHLESLPRGHERILFIDDEKNLVDIGRQMLKHLGYKVSTRTASTGILSLFRKDPAAFDLVISDMAMPGLSGDRLAEALLRLRPDLPIILCTGYNERMSPEKAEEIGIKAFVMKPLVMQDLAETVRRALDQG